MTPPLVDPLPDLAERPPVIIHRPDTPPTDGRAARSYRTMEKIVQAMLHLVEDDGDLRPTADHVASRAGVSRRALYLHFESLEEVFARAAERRTSELFARWEPPASDRPLDSRVAQFARSWSVLLDDLTPLYLASIHHELSSTTVTTTMAQVRAWMRAATESVFRPELMARTQEDRRALATALHYLTSWGAWADLRRQGAGTEEAMVSMQRLIWALLAGRAAFDPDVSLVSGDGSHHGR